MLWGAAVLLEIVTPDDGRTNLILLLVAAGAASACCAVVGFLLSKGSAEQVWQLGYEAGWKAAQSVHVDQARGGKVSVLSTHRR